MARAVTITCSVCKKDKTVGTSGSFTPDICNECRDERKAAQKREHLEGLARLTLEERIARLEEAAYDHDQIAHGYISPPRF